jgi:hypothetical protein
MGSSPVLAPQVLQTAQRVDAMPLVVMWQTTDAQILDILSSISSTSTGSHAASTNASSHTKSDQLSTAAKGGIAAGIVVVFFAMVLGIFCALRPRGRRVNNDRRKTESLAPPGVKSRGITKDNETPVEDDKKRYTHMTDETEKWITIPAFPIPPSSHDLSPKYTNADKETKTEYNGDGAYSYSAVPLQSPGLGSDMHLNHNTNRDVLSPTFSHDGGELLTPTTYTPPGAVRSFSRESTVLNSPTPPFSRDSGRDSATLGSDENLFPLPLDLRNSNSNSTLGFQEEGRRRVSPSPTLESAPMNMSASGSVAPGNRLEHLRDRIQRIREEKERLERIQELRIMEAQTTREIRQEEEELRRRG